MEVVRTVRRARPPCESVRLARLLANVFVLVFIYVLKHLCTYARSFIDVFQCL